MNNLYINNIDLNLLTVFEAVMYSGNTTRAASRLGLTQSAVSHALKRLRILFGDPLFVRTPRGLAPTPVAQEIGTDIHAILKQVETILNREKDFSPHTSARRFVIGLSDYAAFVVLPDLLARLAVEAPYVTVTVKNTRHDAGIGMLEEDEAELIIGNFPAMPPHMRQTLLFYERFVVAGRSDHPGLAGKLTLRKYIGMDHLQISTLSYPNGYVDAVLAKKGVQRKVAVTVPHFPPAPFLLPRTNLIATEPSRLLEPMREALDLVLVEPPFAIPRFAVTLNWHSRYYREPGQQWLRWVIESLYDCESPALSQS